MLPHDQFQRLIDPTNQAAILLATHWIALKQIMAVITEAEGGGAAKYPESGNSAEGSQEPNSVVKKGDPGDIQLGIIRWLKYLNRLVEREYADKYSAWPVWVEGELEKDRGCFGKTR